jgi:hypothetical protein
MYILELSHSISLECQVKSIEDVEKRVTYLQNRLVSYVLYELEIDMLYH